MAITELRTAQVGGEVVVFAASDLTTPTFYWWVNGVYQGSTAQGRRTFVSNNETRIHCFDSATDTPPVAMYPSITLLEWEAYPGAYKYLVQAYADSVWTTIATVFPDGFGTLRYSTGGAAKYRIVPVANGGTLGTTREIEFTAVFRPTPPVVSAVSYAAGVLHVEAA